MPRPVRFASLAVGLLAVLAIAPTAPGQPKNPPAVLRPTVTMYQTMYLGDARLQKELKLTPKQIEKIIPLTRNAMSQQFEARGDAKKFAELNKSQAKALADVLEPNQLERLEQVVYQQLATMRVGSSVLAADERLAKKLELTEKQKEQMQSLVAIKTVLTGTQNKTWSEMIGKTYNDLPLRNMGGFGGPRIVMPQILHYLQQDAVETELRLSEAQDKQITALVEKWEKAFPRPFVATAADRKKAEALGKELTKDAKEVLTEAQRKRLDQITLQQSINRGRDNVVYDLPQVVEALKLADEQKEAIVKIRKDRRESLLPLFVTGEKAAEITTKVAAHKKETGKQLQKVLTDAQAKQLTDDLIGKRFEGNLRMGFGFGGPGGVRPTAPVYSVVLGLNYAASPVLRKELGLDDGQVEKLVALRTKSQGIPLAVPVPASDDGEKKRKEQAEEVEKELGKILKPEQLTRYKQLIYQQYVPKGSYAPLGLTSTLVRIVEVKDGLKLTDAQAKRLRRGAALNKVLDETQQEKWKTMLGKPSTGQLVIGGSGRFVQIPQSLQLAQETSVQEEVKLNDEQKKALTEQVTKYRESYPTEDGSPESAKKVQEYQTTAEATLAKLLDEKQNARLTQIVLQQTRKQGLGMLLTTMPVAEGLKLTADQKKAIASLNLEFNRIRSLAFQELLRLDQQGLAEDYTRTVESLTKITEKELNKVLTVAQRTALEEMLGKKFEGKLELNSGGGFGGGGFVPFRAD